MSADHFDAFISYSHALDGALAPTLQREIERFAKPWYRVRALRVFRDNASLSAEPGLWSAIEEALSRSEWLVLMASPEAAQSQWVGREISWWLAHRSPERILIVVTSGEFVWNEQDGVVDPTASTAVPPALHGALREEPRWVDLRWLREVSQVDRSNPRLRECVADIAAAVHGKPKDSLIGEHIRQHRKAMRLARSAVSALVTLLVVSVIATVVAIAQREEAQNQARIATARQLAATAVANVDTQVDLAQLLAVEAYRMEPTPQTRSALFNSVVASPHLVRNMHIGDSVTALTATAARVAVAGTTRGQLIRLDLSDRTAEQISIGDAPVVDLAATRDGERVIATDGERTMLWDATAGGRTVPIEVADAKEVAISPSGRFAAVLAYQEVPPQDGPDATLTLVDGVTGAELAQTLTTRGIALALPDDLGIVRITGGGSWERLSTSDLAFMAGSDQNLSPIGAQTPGFSSNGEFYGLLAHGNVTVVDTRSTAERDWTEETGYFSDQIPIAASEHFTISNDGEYVATAGGGSLFVSRLRSDPNADDGQTGLIPLSGRGPAEAVAFVGDGTELVSAAGGVLSLWDIKQLGRLSSARVEVPSSPNVGAFPIAAVSPDGSRVAVTSYTGLDYGSAELSVGPSVHDLTRPEPRTVPLGEQYSHHLPLWSPDGTRLLLVSDGGATDVFVDGVVRARWPAEGSARVVAGQVSPDGTRVVLVDQHSGVQVRDADDGQVRRSFPGRFADDADNELYYGDATVNAEADAAVFVADTDTPDDGAFLVDIDTGETRRLAGDAAEAATFGDDVVLVQRDDDALEVWNGRGTTRLRTFTGDVGYARSLAAIPGTGLLARLRGDGSVLISEVESGEVLGSFQLPPMTRSSVPDPWLLTTMTAIADTSQLITATPGGQLVSWELSSEAWTRIACETAGRALTSAEWQRHVGSELPDILACSRT